MLESRSLSSSNCIKTFDFSIPYSPLKAKRQIERISPTVFHKEEWRTQIQMPCLRKGHILFCKQKHSGSTKKFSETDIMNMLEFLIENIFVMFGGRVFQQTVRLRVLPVLPFSVTRSFIPTNQTSYRDFRRERKRS